MRGINKVILIGSLGRDPEIRYTPTGGAVANLSVATSESWRDKNTGQQQEQTEWHRVVFYGKLAEIAGEYLKKGSKVYVEGSLHTRKWQDKQTGQDRYSTEIKANTLQFLDGKPSEGESRGNQSGFGQSQQASRSYTNNAYAEASRGSSSGQARHIDNDFSDDIPFN